MDGPVDYLSGLGVLADPLKSIQQQLAFSTGISRQQAETEQAQAQIKEINQKLTRAQDFQKDLAAVHANPDAQAVSSLIMKYPEFADQLKSGWDVKDNAAKQADLTQLGETYSAAVSGNWSLALKHAQARVDADKAAGKADPNDQAFVDQLTAASGGDENAKRAVLTTLGTHIAAVSGPEHFASVYGALKGGYTLDAGATRYDENGHVVAQSPFIKGNDGAIFERDGANATPPFVPPSKTEQPGGDDGFNTAVATVLKHEGGYNPHDINGAPVNFGINQGANPDVDVKSLTQDEAAQIYKEKYWGPSRAADLPASMQAPYFDTYIINPKRAQQFLKAAGNDPNRFMTMRENWMQSLAKKDPAKYGPVMKGWANRNADLRLTIAGTDTSKPYYPESSGNAAPPSGGTSAPPGYHLLVPGSNSPDQFRTLTSAEAKARGLPDGQIYQLNSKNGQVTPVSGTDTGDDLDPQTANLFAQQYLSTGQMPPMGMGKAAAKMRQQIMKQVATIAGADGLSGRDLATQIAHFKAGQANVTNLEKQLGTVEGNERTFQLNAQQVLQRSSELPAQTGSRILNTPIQSYLRQTNDPTIAALDVAIKTASNEYARLVTASPSGAGVLSDSARQEYQGIIQGNFPLKQKIAALRQMQVDARNRTKSLKGNLQDAYSHLTDRAPELKGGGSKDLPKGAKVVGTYQGRRVIEVNGKRMVEQ